MLSDPSSGRVFIEGSHDRAYGSVIPKRTSTHEMLHGINGTRGILVLISQHFRSDQDSSLRQE